jgi:excisionase family DNA binding protein
MRAMRRGAWTGPTGLTPSNVSSGAATARNLSADPTKQEESRCAGASSLVLPHRRLDPATPAQIGIESHYPFNVTEPWISAEVIAEHLGVTKDSIYTWIAKKDMPAHPVGRLWKFKVTEVDARVRQAGTDETSGNDAR